MFFLEVPDPILNDWREKKSTCLPELLPARNSAYGWGSQWAISAGTRPIATFLHAGSQFLLLKSDTARKS